MLKARIIFYIFCYLFSFEHLFAQSFTIQLSGSYDYAINGIRLLTDDHDGFKVKNHSGISRPTGELAILWHQSDRIKHHFGFEFNVIGYDLRMVYKRSRSIIGSLRFAETFYYGFGYEWPSKKRLSFGITNKIGFHHRTFFREGPFVGIRVDREFPVYSPYTAFLYNTRDIRRYYLFYTLSPHLQWRNKRHRVLLFSDLTFGLVKVGLTNIRLIGDSEKKTELLMTERGSSVALGIGYGYDFDLNRKRKNKKKN